MSDLTELQSSQSVKIAGADTSGVEQGFVSIMTDAEGNNRFRVVSKFSVLNRADVSGTFTTTGASAALDSEGFGSLSCLLNVTAESGTNPTLDVNLQESDDQATWATLACFNRATAVTTEDMDGISITKRYYRWAYTIAGTTPSFTFSVTMTLKQIEGNYVGLKKYSDLAFTSGAVSSTFDSRNLPFVSVHCIRTDALGNGNVQFDCSNDNLNWSPLTANVALNAGTNVFQSIFTTAARYYRVRSVTNVASGASAVINLHWRAVR